MATYQIAILIGSLRKDSYNRKFADALTKLSPDNFNFKHIDIGDLPLYNQDDDERPAASVKRFKSEIASSQGVLFATAEYNRSVPGILKNAIDHGSRPYGHSVWAGRPAGIVGVSPGAIGTALSQQHLRTVLAYLDMPTLGQPEIFVQQNDTLYKSDGSFSNDTTKLMKTWMDRYVAWVIQHAS